MKNYLLALAEMLKDCGRKFDHIGLLKEGEVLRNKALQLPDDSSPQTTSDEQNDDGGIEVPKKPPPP